MADPKTPSSVIDLSEKELKRTIELPPDPSDRAELGTMPQPPSIEFHLELENLTAQTHLEPNHRVRIVQLMEKGLVLEVPEKTCAVGHHISFHLKCKGIEPLIIDFSATGKVESLERFSDQMEQIKLKLIQYPEDPWEALHKMLSDRQKQVTQFLETVKGRE